MNKKFFLYALLLIFSFPPAFAANYYIDDDCTYNGNGAHNNGTCAAGTGQAGPYNSANSPTYSSNNNYYFRCGTSESNVDIDTSADSIKFSAYYVTGGTVYHEDEQSPAMENPPLTAQQKCTNGDNLPYLGGTGSTGNVIYIMDGSDGAHITCLEFGDSGTGATGGGASILAEGINMTVEYVKVGKNSKYGMRFGLSAGCQTVTVRHVIADSNGAGDLCTVGSCDGIQFGKYCDYVEAYDLFLNDWGHASVCVTPDSSNIPTNIEIYDFAVHDEQGYSSEAVIVQGDGNKFHDFWVKDAGVIAVGGKNNKVYRWVKTGHSDEGISDDACIKFVWADGDVDSNLISQFVCYKGQGTNAQGILFFAQDNSYGCCDSSSSISSNILENGILLDVDDDAIRISDITTVDDVIGRNGQNIFRYIKAYNWDIGDDGGGTDYYASINTGDTDANYSTATAFNNANSSGDFDGQSCTDTDPDFVNETQDDFRPTQNGNLVDTGRASGDPYNKLWTSTTFDTMPITISNSTDSPTDMGPYQYYSGQQQVQDIEGLNLQ